MVKRTIFSGCLLLSLALARAQVYPINKYSSDDGLAHSNVFRIMQDKKGFLWFSTNYGVSCFNGKSFKNYTTEDGLSGNIIMSITELQNGNKMVNSLSGVDLIVNDSVRPLTTRSGKLPSRVIYSKEFDGKVWMVALLKGFFLYCLDNGIARCIDVYDAGGKPVRITKLETTSDGRLLFVSDKGLFSYQSSQGIRPFLQELIHEAEITSFKEDKTGNFWVGLTDRLLCIRNGKIIYTFRPGFNSGVSDLLVDSKNNVWACIPQLGIFLVQNGIATNITAKLGIKKILINNLFEDNEKNIWMATHGDGVYKISSLGITNYFPETDKLNVYARSLALEQPDNVLVGSYGTITQIKNNLLAGLPIRSLLSTDYIYFIRITANRLYIGIPTGVLIKDRITGEEKKIRTDGAISYLDVSADSIWIGGFQNIGCITDDKYSRLNIPPIYDRRINCMIKSPDGSRLLGTDSGLYKYQNGIWSQEAVAGNTGEPYINALLYDRQGRLWVASDKGLFMKSNQGWISFTEKNGLSHSKCNCLAEDEDQNIWVGTKNGLNRIDRQNLSITEHPTGLYPNEILSLLFDQQKNLVVGTVNGIALISERKNEITTRPPPLYITGLIASGRNYTNPGQVTLKAGDQKILIEYIALSYSYPNNVEYRYRLENIYTEWNITKNSSIELSALSPGKYRLVLQARVNGGEWGEPATLGIIIPQVIWRSGWFLLLIGLGLALLIYYLMRWQLLRKEKKKHEALNIQSKMNHLRQQALGALISPHFIFNCLNSIQHYLNRNDKELANHYLSRFGKLIRLTLEYAQEMYIPLTVESDRLSLYLELEKLRCGDQLAYKLEIDTSLFQDHVSLPNMILQPYVENAIWHGIMPKQTGGNLIVKISRAGENEMLVRIEDDGIGIAANANTASSGNGHISFGMDLIRERLELFKRSSNRNYSVAITDQSSIDDTRSGTVVELHLPLTTGR